MANYLGPKVKLSRRVGVPIADIPKHTGRQLTTPGIHGYRGRRLKDYGIRLNEKQKLRYHYNVMEKQFRGYVHEANRRKGNSGQVMIILLEKRLDNVIRRLGYARTIWAARQMVVHGHIQVNGHKTDRPSYAIQVGDKISIKGSAEKLVRENLESLPGHEVPGWLSFTPADLSAAVVAEPTINEIPFDVNMNLIIEFYR